MGGGVIHITHHHRHMRGAGQGKLITNLKKLRGSLGSGIVLVHVGLAGVVWHGAVGAVELSEVLTSSDDDQHR